MSGRIRTLSVDITSVCGASLVVGLDFGVPTPGKKFSNIDVNFYDGNVMFNVPDSILNALDKLFICERKIFGTGGL